MNKKDILIEDFTDERFEEAFKEYFSELGVEVRGWQELFSEMNNDPNGKNIAYLRLTGEGDTIGFIQLSVIGFTSWFFDVKAGFIREFWVAPKFRNKGNGSELISLAEKHFLSLGLGAVILTTDTAPEFFEKRGYISSKIINARNGDEVLIKTLSKDDF